MLLDEPVEQPGFFWLPDQDQDQIPGTLRIERSGRIYVDLFGVLDVHRDDPHRTSLNPSSWSSFPRAAPYERIHGLIQGEVLTLDDCLSVASNRRLAGGVSQSTLNAGRAYIGAWYECGETPTFSRMVISIDGLHQWLLLSGLDSETEHNNDTITKITHSFEPPPEITTRLTENIELAFGLSWSESGIGPDTTEATITQRADMVVRYGSPVPLDDHLNTSLKFQRLLALAVNRSVDIMSLTGYSSDFMLDSREKPVQIYIPGSDFEQATRDLRWFRMLFTYPDIQHRFGEVIATWFDKYDAVGPAINLYDGLVSGGYRYLEGRFLATVQAIETFHRYHFPDQGEMPADDYSELVETVVDAVPQERQEWLRQRIQHANEPNLRKRLRELIKPFASLFGTKRERERFIGTAVDTRNSLAHTAMVRDGLADDLGSFFRLQQKLEALFQLHLLKLLGFSYQEIEKIAEKQELKRKLS